MSTRITITPTATGCRVDADGVEHDLAPGGEVAVAAWNGVTVALADPHADVPQQPAAQQ